jgi:hypothetical protein
MSNVNELYQALVQQGYSQKDAAKEAQARTGFSAVTGQPIRSKSINWKKNFKQFKTKFGGQYGQ